MIWFSYRLTKSPIFPLCLLAVVTTESDTMPGQIPDPSVTAGSLPSLGPLAGISATTLTDKLKFGDIQEFGTMLSPLHFLDTLRKRPLVIKTEVEVTLSSWYQNNLQMCFGIFLCGRNSVSETGFVIFHTDIYHVII